MSATTTTTTTNHGALVAQFGHLLNRIRLFEDGWIDAYEPGGCGYCVGAVAHVDEAGNKRILSDWRTAYLANERPGIALAVKVDGRNRQKVTKARQFAARVNQRATLLGEREGEVR
jgi:hypothetical protein